MIKGSALSPILHYIYMEFLEEERDCKHVTAPSGHNMLRRRGKNERVQSNRGNFDTKWIPRSLDKKHQEKEG
jgi:hypothetical protein